MSLSVSVFLRVCLTIFVGYYARGDGSFVTTGASLEDFQVCVFVFVRVHMHGACTVPSGWLIKDLT